MNWEWIRVWESMVGILAGGALITLFKGVGEIYLRRKMRQVMAAHEAARKEKMGDVLRGKKSGPVAASTKVPVTPIVIK